MTAHLLRERSAMRLIALALLFAAPAAAAYADPVQEARSATGACLAAVIDGAPVEDIDGDDVSIRRGREPLSCTVRVAAGEPVLIHDAVMSALKRRTEAFGPARTRWEAGNWASRETFCSLPGRRSYAVFVSTAKPGAQTVLTATVFETKERDQRCDRDLGIQTVAAADAPPTASSASTALADEPARIATPPAPEKKKRGLLSRIPGLNR
jgi:hypothetical protein